MGKQDVFGLDRGNRETWMSSAEGKPNKPVEKIAKKHDVSEEVVEQILQIYTTHPGITTDGHVVYFPLEEIAVITRRILGASSLSGAS